MSRRSRQTLSSTPPRSSRNGWIALAVGLALLVYITANTLRTDSEVGSRGVEAGRELPPFAVPLAGSDLEGDANVAVQRDQGQAGARPACEVRGEDILNVCALAERGPVVLAFLATRGADCTGALDVLERARERHPGVRFAAVGIRGDRRELARLAREHGWSFPVGYDRDGVLANLYGVAVCPQVTYATWGGTVRGTTLGRLDPRALDRRLTALERRSRELGWKGAPR